MKKWRPSLWFVVMGGLGGTLLVSFLGLVVLRYVGPVMGFRETAALLAVAITAATTVLGVLLARLLLRPVDALSAHARAVRLGGDAPPPAHFGTRELHALALSVLDMGAALRGREAAIRTYTDHVTHEVKTPVTAIRAAAELLEDEGRADPRLLAQITGATAQIEAQLAALRAMSAAREPGHGGTGRVEEVLDALRAAHPGLDVTVTGDAIPLPLAASGLRIVLGHLLGNAQQAGATQVRIAVDAGGLTIRDNGPGVSPGNAPHLFEPFFTTRRESGGTGMGLAIVQSLLAAHGWSIATVEGPGLCLRLDAP